MFIKDSTMLISFELEDRFNVFAPKVKKVLLDTADPVEQAKQAEIVKIVDTNLRELMAEELKNGQLLKQLLKMLVHSPVMLNGLTSTNGDTQKASLDLLAFIKDCAYLFQDRVPDVEPLALKVKALVDASKALEKDPQNDMAHKTLQLAIKQLAARF